jgi:hypothetical protein
MKQYVIDQLSPEDYDKVKDYLDKHFSNSGIDGIYWIPVNDDLLTEVQKKHKDCSPFFFAIEIVPNKMSCELLVRTKNRMRCDCIQHATESQRNWLIEFADSIFDRLKIKI